MIPPRSLEEQFEPKLADRLRKLQGRLELVCTTGRASDYFVFEAASCLDRGLLLGSLQLSTAGLELRVRELLVQHIILGQPRRKGPLNGIQICVEEDRKCSFSEMLDILDGRAVIDNAERQKLKRIYREIRVPLHHGIVVRYSRRHDRDVDEPVDCVLQALEDAINVYLTASEGEMESVLESYGATDLDSVISGLELLTPKLKRLIALSY